MNRKSILHEHHYPFLRQWAHGLQQLIPDQLPENTSFILYLSPPPFSFIVGCGMYEAAHQAVRPLILLKDPVASYYLPFPLETGELSLTEWQALCEAILFHNPGLTGALQRLSHDYFSNEQEC
ncbi:hypothetical protein [Marinococcus sp. PL1-022]|uniref:hypothetical protein n=1 Tax=Marinococcus sp. PL1-022 TaxID=3095363 RepID=UPI0029C31692|nr:hypothetical protein [Marinococcus sp. PL1-022]MDX6154499.1 hypothetical protein [Marinococcus sp. PL1-022]